MVDCVTDRRLVGQEEDVSHSLLKEKHEIKTAPAYVEAAWTAGPA